MSQVAYEVEDLMGFIQRQHDTAMGAMHGQVAPPMSAPGAGSPGRPMGGFSGAPAAAAPGALLGAGADGAPLAPTGGWWQLLLTCCCATAVRQLGVCWGAASGPRLPCQQGQLQAGRLSQRDL